MLLINTRSALSLSSRIKFTDHLLPSLCLALGKILKAGRGGARFWIPWRVALSRGEHTVRTQESMSARGLGGGSGWSGPEPREAQLPGASFISENRLYLS